METHTVWKLYVPAMINRVEEWLSSKSEVGWDLIAYNGWKFSFFPEKKTPKRKQYFMYSGFDAKPGFSYDFLSAKERYGNKKSKISSKELCVFEIDENKKDQSFYSYLNARNNYYKKHYIGLSIFSLLLVLLVILLISYENKLFPLLIITGFVHFYADISLIIISLDQKKLNHQSRDGSKPLKKAVKQQSNGSDLP